MARIGFLGLGNMGLPMAKNLAAAGHEIVGFDLSQAACEAAGAAGITVAADAAGTVAGAETVITMLPAGQHVRGACRPMLPRPRKPMRAIPNSPSSRLLV